MLYYKQELYLQTVQQRWMCSAACYFLYQLGDDSHLYRW